MDFGNTLSTSEPSRFTWSCTSECLFVRTFILIKPYVCYARRNKEEGTEAVYGVSKIINHPKYSRTTIKNDIALIKLKKPVTLKKEVGLACIPEQGDDVPVQSICWITGVYVFIV